MVTGPLVVDRAASILFSAVIVTGALAGMVLEVPPLLSPAQFKAFVADTPLVIRVRDLDTAAAWYQEKLGLTRVAALPDEVPSEPLSKVVLINGANRVELIQRGSSLDVARFFARRGSEPSSVGPPALRVDDIDAATEELKSSGVAVIEGPRLTKSRKGLRVSLIYDLEGQVIELQQPL